MTSPANQVIEQAADGRIEAEMASRGGRWSSDRLAEREATDART